MALHMLEAPPPAMPALPITDDDRAFFVALGERMAQFRKARGLTQAQLAETLGLTQQTYQSYEVGRRRIPVSALPHVARALSVTLEDLFGETDSTSRSKRGPMPKWQKQIEAIAQLPRAKQQFVARVLDTVLAQESR
ncbi:XRE family transcriptional regulator [Burkholderia ubonensis]|uniref:XRE family transcriptional regulator n=2 Tax=Burkholderia ubonensis TaxID=101571 RepID=A0A125G4H7_9BURK|nr:XRE family transcriptional regulator [Burkholderia ubonensis]KWD78425.1 XRE family transcriptional regulator [Burkholderia ubonensis]KWD87624.1 XRE family transcriptional regulator [Burkholderia ubonensis]KWD87631.1 XRE family transcriptional regulator [Burkholderia ubonensis]KWD89767.1 XRE family transcriptional regulator [Burkholderia ubonensis]